MTDSFTITDRRFDARYIVFHDADTFIGCHVFYAGRVDPTVVERLSDLPPQIRSDVESRLCQPRSQQS